MAAEFLVKASILLAVLCVCECVKFGQLCTDNPTNAQRTNDIWGQGHFNAGRGNHLHKGLDIACTDGSTVLAPFDVTLNGKVVVYTDPAKQAINDGINLKGQGLCFKLFYIKPVKESGVIMKGEKLGTMLPMQSVYPGITSHIHVQMCNKSDPSKYFST